MTTEKQALSPEQKELVAVGAGVGAGCRPCVSHHLKAGAEAGLAGGRLLAAVASAERVCAEAAVAMGDHARAKLGPDVASPALLSRLEEALASLGAALGANDPPTSNGSCEPPPTAAPRARSYSRRSTPLTLSRRTQPASTCARPSAYSTPPPRRLPRRRPPPT